MSKRNLIGLPMSVIPTPALVVDIATLESNIDKMMSYLAGTNVKIRPHAKSHKTPMIGHLQIKTGSIGLCCATVGEAEEMVYAGIDNILIANEVIGEDKIRRAINLANQSNVMVVVDNKENVQDLSNAAMKKGIVLGVLVDIDVGQHRCGVRDIESAIYLTKLIIELPGLKFCGLMGYEGHTMFIVDRQEREKAAKAANKVLVDTVKAIETAGIPVEIVSCAGTGTYDIASQCPGITEIEAGSYIFMDGTYSKLGLPFEQSLTILSTVLSHPDDKSIVFDVGIKGISVERAFPQIMGMDNVIIDNLSEEHAQGRIISATNLKPGDKVNMIPTHCCSTVNLYNEMYIVRNGIVEAIWPITARGVF